MELFELGLIAFLIKGLALPLLLELGTHSREGPVALPPMLYLRSRWLSIKRFFPIESR